MLNIIENMEQELMGIIGNPCLQEAIKNDIDNKLDKAGIYYHSFARIKSPHSIAIKLNHKNYSDGEKMQDIVGVRIVLYFRDDIELCNSIIHQRFKVSQEDSEHDIPKFDEFGVERLNLICRLPDEFHRLINPKIWDNYPIDKTFELQIRTIFSEGWHEVDHDIRYKHKDEWKKEEYYTYNRELNSIKATLDVCDSAILNWIDRLTYDCYKKEKVEEMLRYKFRIHLSNEQLSKKVSECLTHEIKKELYRIDREDVLMFFASPQTSDMPKTLDNIVYICNLLQINDEKIRELTPKVLIEDFKTYLISKNM